MPVRLSRRRNGAAFTLVELLVVIGIIALLISILLPSLSRARQAANVIKCQSNMRQMGQAFQLYAYENDGYLPWANTPNDPNSDDDNTADGGDKPRWWVNALGAALGSDLYRLNPIFTDVDAPDADTSWAVFSTEGGEKNHFVANIRLVPPYPLVWAPGVFPDPFAGVLGLTGNQSIANRKIASVNNASETALVWDSSVWAWWNGDAFYISDGADSWRIWYDHYYVFPANPDLGHDPDYDRPLAEPNVDWVDGQTQGTVRFRHMRDTVANVLYVDGHVESKKINPVTGRSDFVARELCVSYLDAIETTTP